MYLFCGQHYLTSFAMQCFEPFSFQGHGLGYLKITVVGLYANRVTWLTLIYYILLGNPGSHFEKVTLSLVKLSAKYVYIVIVFIAMECLFSNCVKWLYIVTVTTASVCSYSVK